MYTSCTCKLSSWKVLTSSLMHYRLFTHTHRYHLLFFCDSCSLLKLLLPRANANVKAIKLEIAWKMKIPLPCHLNGKLLFSLWEEWILLHSSQSSVMVVDDRYVCLWKWSGQCLWHDNIQYGSSFRSDLRQGLMKLRSLFSPLGRLLSCEIMMTSSNGNIFRVTGPLCGDFSGRQWIPLTKTSDAER